MAMGIRTCEVCGREFMPKNGRVRCCSARCSQRRQDKIKLERRKADRAAYGLDGRREGVLHVVGNCCVCGKPLEAYRATRRYCDSVWCRRIGMLMGRHGLTLEAAKILDQRLAEKRVEKAERKRRRADADGQKHHACDYFGKVLPTNPSIFSMSPSCLKNGMSNVCTIKGRCPYGRRT